jgi:hypothetical protein
MIASPALLWVMTHAGPRLGDRIEVTHRMYEEIQVRFECLMDVREPRPTKNGFAHPQKNARTALITVRASLLPFTRGPS